MRGLLTRYLALFDAPIVNAILDGLILIVALAPALIISQRLLFSDAATAKRLQKSPVLLGWMIFFCGLEVFFHLMKAPLLLKIVAVVLGIVLIPVMLLLEPTH